VAKVTLALAIFDVILAWQSYLEVTDRAGENTRRQYRRIVVNYVADIAADPAWGGPRDPLQVSEDDLVSWLAHYTPAQGGTRGQAIRALRSLYRYASDREIIGTDPSRHLRAARPKYGPAPSLSAEEIDHILRAAERIDPRARWAIQLQYATGCRIGSLVEVMPTDVRVSSTGLTVIFRQAKFDRPYEVPLGPMGTQAVERLIALADYLAPKTTHRRPTLLGVGENRYRQWLKAAAEQAEVKAWSHLLRHSAATVWAANGVDTRTIMELANWETPAMLRRYAARSDENMRAAAI
jgi:integrase/recombinase XerD